jgi:iron(II)-dependent oxidoreductase
LDKELSVLIGSLLIQSEPADADVFLDHHDYLGKTPAFKQNLIVGWHQITLKKEGFEEYRDEFRLSYGQEKKIEAKLKAKPGRLIISSSPSMAQVVVNGKNIGWTPIDQQFPPGNHQLQINKENYNKHVQSLIINSNKNTFLDIRLQSTHNEVSGMILIPAGEFIAGNDEGEESEKPARKVWVDAFYIDKYEVTNSQFREFVRSTNHRPPVFLYQKRLGVDNQPVVGVSWYDAVAYAKWTGKRLPTEAEWEKAARGIDGRKYPWGTVWDKEKNNSAESKMMQPAPVGSFPGGASPFGVMDMAGNVWEWTADWFVNNYYTFAPSKNPKGARFGTTRSVRGGSWVESPELLTTSYRKGVLPTLRTSNTGFRCVMDY